MYAYWITVNYREAYQMFACNGILFNHESPVRGETFVTRKITMAAARIALGLQDQLFLGNLSAKRDWGHAKDYVEAMWLMLQQDKPEDFVIATGVTHTVRHFCELAFKEAGIELEFKGDGEKEVGVDKKDGRVLISVDKAYFRPTEVELLIGDASKAEKKLGWKPKYTLAQMVKEMVESDLNEFRQDQLLEKAGFKTKRYFE